MQKKVEINDRDFFKTPFTRSEIDALLQKKHASEMFSFRSPSFKSLGLDPAKLNPEQQKTLQSLIPEHAPKVLAEPHAAWVNALEQEWLRRYGTH